MSLLWLGPCYQHAKRDNMAPASVVSHIYINIYIYMMNTPKTKCQKKQYITFWGSCFGHFLSSHNLCFVAKHNCTKFRLFSIIKPKTNRTGQPLGQEFDSNSSLSGLPHLSNRQYYSMVCITLYFLHAIMSRHLIDVIWNINILVVWWSMIIMA